MADAGTADVGQVLIDESEKGTGYWARDFDLICCKIGQINCRIIQGLNPGRPKVPLTCQINCCGSKFIIRAGISA